MKIVGVQYLESIESLANPRTYSFEAPDAVDVGAILIDPQAPYSDKGWSYVKVVTVEDGVYRGARRKLVWPNLQAD